MIAIVQLAGKITTRGAPTSSSGAIGGIVEKPVRQVTPAYTVQELDAARRWTLRLHISNVIFA